MTRAHILSVGYNWLTGAVKGLGPTIGSPGLNQKYLNHSSRLVIHTQEESLSGEVGVGARWGVAGASRNYNRSFRAKVRVSNQLGCLLV